MKLGITFGGYAPLHKGHMDLILEGKKENDYMIVVCCGHDDDKRTNTFGSLTEKYYKVKNFLEDDIIKVLMIDDKKLNILDNKKENYITWLNEVIRQIKEKYNFIPLDNNESNNKDTTLTFYVGEKEYNDDLLNLDKLNEEKNIYPFKIKVKYKDRELNKISGTMIRNNPLKYWNNIMLPFRPELTKNILISGTASEGKTTLIEDLGKYFTLPYSNEKGRDISLTKTDDLFTLEDFIYFTYEQHKINKDMKEGKDNNGIFISDTDFCTTLMYAKRYAENKDFVLTNDDFKVLLDISKEYAKRDKWEKIFLLAPKEKPLVDDGIRYLGDSDYFIRCKMFKDLKAFYDMFGYTYEVLDGTYLENFNRVKEYINDLLKEKDYKEEIKNGKDERNLKERIC